MLTLASLQIDWNHQLLPLPPNPGQKKVLLTFSSGQRGMGMCFYQYLCPQLLSTGDQTQGLMNARQTLPLSYTAPGLLL